MFLGCGYFFFNLRSLIPMKSIQVETIKASIISGIAKPTLICRARNIAGRIRMAISAPIPVMMLSFFILFSLDV